MKKQLLLLGMIALPFSAFAQSKTVESELTTELEAPLKVAELPPEIKISPVAAELDPEIKEAQAPDPNVKATSKTILAEKKDFKEVVAVKMDFMPSKHHPQPIEGEQCMGMGDCPCKGDKNHSYHSEGKYRNMKSYSKHGPSHPSGTCPVKNKLMLLAHCFIFGGLVLLFLYLSPFLIRRGWAAGDVKNDKNKTTTKRGFKVKAKKK